MTKNEVALANALRFVDEQLAAGETDAETAAAAKQGLVAASALVDDIECRDCGAALYGEGQCEVCGGNV